MATVPIAGTIIRRVKRERPDIEIEWRDGDGDLIDFSAYSFTFSVARSPGAAAIITKTSGISYVVDPDEEFNVLISFAPNEIDALVAGIPYNCQLDAMSAGTDRGFQDFILLLTPAHA